jgi:quercetin dioxygenase-like cupin family protein
MTVETLEIGGQTIEFLTPVDDATCVFRGTIPAGGGVHLHSHADPEAFVAVSGTAEGYIEGSGWRRVGPGDALAIPDNAKHAWRNEGDEPAVMIVVTTATMGRFFREVAGASLEEFLATADRYGFWNSISG